MRPEYFDFISDLNTVWAVVLGALFASVSGFSAARIERILERRQRERDAALFFGEILATLGIVLDMTIETKKIGDPFGPITMRMLRLAHREIDVYDRNRERLFDLQDIGLRSRIHSAVLHLIVPLESVIEMQGEIGAAEAQARTDRAAGMIVEQLRERRESAFDFVARTSEQLKACAQALEPIAHQSFQAIDGIVREF